MSAISAGWSVLKMPERGFEGADRFDPETGELIEGYDWPKTDRGMPMLPERAMELHAESDNGMSIQMMKQGIEAAMEALKKERSALGIYGAFPDFNIRGSQRRIAQVAQQLQSLAGGM